MIPIMLSCILFTTIIMNVQGMEFETAKAEYWALTDEGKFSILLEKMGTIYCLTERDKTNISSFIAQKFPLEVREAINEEVFKFINAQIVEPMRIDTVYDYTSKGYFFRLMSFKKESKHFEVTETHCDIIAAWLEKQKIEKTSDRTCRLEVTNRGRYFMLKADNTFIYEPLAASSPVRKYAMDINNLIACLSIQDNDCYDITDQGLSAARLRIEIDIKKIN